MAQQIKNGGGGGVGGGGGALMKYIGIGTRQLLSS